MEPGNRRTSIRFPRVARAVMVRHDRTPPAEPATAPARSTLLGNLAALFTGIGALIAFVGSSYYAALFGHFGLQPSVLEISQAERMSIGVFAAFATLAPSFGVMPIFLRAILAGMAVGCLIVGLVGTGLRRKWRWSEAIRDWCRSSSTAGEANAWSMRIMVIALGIGIGLIAGNHAGDHDAKAYRNRIHAGLGCDYRFGGETLHGVLLGQDHARSLIITAAGVKIMDNVAFAGVGPTATDCLDKPAQVNGSRPG